MSPSIPTQVFIINWNFGRHLKFNEFNLQKKNSGIQHLNKYGGIGVVMGRVYSVPTAVAL